MPRKFTVGEGFGASMTGLVRAYSMHREDKQRRRQEELQSRQVAVGERQVAMAEQKLPSELKQLESQAAITTVQAEGAQTDQDIRMDILREQAKAGKFENISREAAIEHATSMMPVELRTSLAQATSAEAEAQYREATLDLAYDMMTIQMEKETLDNSYLSGGFKDDEKKAAYIKRAGELKQRESELENELKESLIRRNNADAAGVEQEVQMLAEQKVAAADIQANSGYPGFIQTERDPATGKLLPHELKEGSEGIVGWGYGKNDRNDMGERVKRLMTEGLPPKFMEQTAVLNVQAETGWTAGDVQEQIAAFAVAINSNEPANNVIMLESAAMLESWENGAKDDIEGYIPQNMRKGSKKAISAIEEFFNVKKDAGGRFDGDPTTYLQIPMEVYEAAGAIPEHFARAGFSAENMADQVGEYRRDVQWDMYTLRKLGASEADVTLLIGNTMAWMKDNPGAAEMYKYANGLSQFEGPPSAVSGVGSRATRLAAGKVTMQGGGATLMQVYPLIPSEHTYGVAKDIRQELAMQAYRERTVDERGNVYVGGLASPFRFLRAMRNKRKGLPQPKPGIPFPYSQYPARLLTPRGKTSSGLEDS